MTAPDLSRAVWRKSRRSNAGGSCVEVAAVWRKSSRSNDGGSCVEVAARDSLIAVRDSKNPNGPKLVLPRATWQGLTTEIKTGTYDL